MNGDSTARLTVRDAADAMGISAEAVRQRIKRGTLPTERDSDGAVWVLLDGDRMRTNDRTNGDRMRTDDRTDGDRMRTDDQASFVARLEDEVEWLRREVERKDTLLMALMQRVPELEAPRNGHKTAPAEPDREEHRPAPEGAQEAAEPRSWWRRMFGG